MVKQKHVWKKVVDLSILKLTLPTTGNTQLGKFHNFMFEK